MLNLYRLVDGDHNEEALSNAITNILKDCQNSNVKSIAIPALATGQCGMPINKSASAIYKGIWKFVNGEEKEEVKSKLERKRKL